MGKRKSKREEFVECGPKQGEKRKQRRVSGKKHQKRREKTPKKRRNLDFGERSNNPMAEYFKREKTEGAEKSGVGKVGRPQRQRTLKGERKP